MKTIKLFLLTCFTALAFSCANDDDATGETAVFAIPVIKSLDEIRSGVGVSAAIPTDADGKIYVAENYIFYIAQEQGVHVFNNSNPAAPQNSVFLNIEGVHDIAIKGDRLYADNYMDMVVFDISDMANINLIQTVPNAFNFYPGYPEDAEFYDYTIFAGVGEIVTGFRLETRARPDYEYGIAANDALQEFDAASGAAVGTGGSYARFQINNNALYSVESYQLNVFNISNPENAFYDKAVYVNEWLGGGELETLFKQKDFLFVGSTMGMYIANAEDEFNPEFISGFSHATACDPVVVQGNTAYITVRGGTSCGAIEDQVNVIDITDIMNPTLTSTYLLNQPYGLGISGDALYVCCGSEGLKVFDATGSELILQNSYSDEVIDVIPMSSHLIAVGPNTIRQYNYGPDFTLIPISVLNF
jgi:hypothetical protein